VKHRPTIVQHSFGAPGSGGPVTALSRLLASDLSQKYDFVPLHQDCAAGGIDVSMLRRWVRTLRRVKPDLVHVRGLGNEGFHGALAARLAGCPRVLVSVHGTVRDLNAPHSLRRQVVARGLEPATLRFASDIVTVCRATAERSFLDPYRRKLVGVVPNGVRVQSKTPGHGDGVRLELGLGPDDVALIVVGRLTVEKGHLVLARALARLDAERARMVLLVVGDGPDRAQIESSYRSVEGLRVMMLGQRQEVSRLLSAADVFVFPTLHENLSNALLEGMAAGLPVIASRVGGNVEVLEGGGGTLVPPAESAPLADAIAELMNDPSARLSRGQIARRVVNERYTLAHMVAGWDEVYERILGTH